MKQVSYALVSLIASAIVLFYLIPYKIGEVSLNKANPLQSPTVVPYLFAIIAILVSTLMLLHHGYKAFVKQQTEDETVDKKEFNAKRFVISLVSGVVFLLLLPIVGIEAAVIIFIVGLLLAVGEKRPLLYIQLIIIAVAIAEFFIFVVNVPLTTTIEAIGGLL